MHYFINNLIQEQPSNERGVSIVMRPPPPHPQFSSTTGSETYQPSDAVSDRKASSMSDESFLRYRLEVVRRMPEGAYKSALVAAIVASLAALRSCRNKLSSICVCAD